MRIIVLCPHPENRAPAQRLKYEQYFPSWRSAGYDVDVRPFWNERTSDVLYRPGHWLAKTLGVANGFLRRIRDGRAATRADLAYVFLEAIPVGPPVIERRIARRGIPLVYDIDDLVYLPHSSQHHGFMRRLRNPNKALELMSIADHVVVCTPHLEEVARQHNDRVTLISSTIDTSSYVARPHRPRTDQVVVGWSGSHSTAPYLHLLDDVVRELQGSDGIRVKVIGDASFSIDGVEVNAQPWRLATEVEDLSEIDVGVYPLPNEEWVLGKSGLKALQYMALEIPTVAQDVGTNGRIIEHGRNGFLVSTKEEWLRTLRALIRDPELRRTIGTAARATVEERYSVKVTAPVYLAVLLNAAGRS